VLQDVLTRLDRAFQRFFARVKTGETPGYPRFHGANRYNSFTYKQVGSMAAHASIMGSSSCPRLAGLPFVGHVH
jgi:putative transposase